MSPLNLAFLDIMSCGLGAVVLIFLLIKHNVNSNNIDDNNLMEEATVLSKINLELESEIDLLSKKNLETLKKITDLKTNLENFKKEQSDIKEDILGIDEENKTLEGKLKKEEGNLDNIDLVNLDGKNEQSYLTGLKIEGDSIIILMDTSASMSDEKLINIIQRKISSNKIKSEGKKWLQTVRAVKWILARLPEKSNFQFIYFNENSKIYSEKTKMFKAKDKKVLNEIILSLSSLFPEKGTNLLSAFEAARKINATSPNIYLITDGLPTIGKKTNLLDRNKNSVSPKERLNIFRESESYFIKNFPRSSLNIILLPLEGDIDASYHYWQFTKKTNGLFLSPSKDWP
ncbi:MAG: hypothetical protein CML94_04345 [Rhodobiaceae bacterium]|nr:hypothetical protein [Rhodobiaceae bacterium]